MDLIIFLTDFSLAKKTQFYQQIFAIKTSKKVHKSRYNRKLLLHNSKNLLKNFNSVLVHRFVGLSYRYFSHASIPSRIPSPTNRHKNHCGSSVQESRP